MKQNPQAAIEKWVTQQVRQLTAYSVPMTDKSLKLDAMESSYDIPASLKQQWIEQMQSVAINRYPRIHNQDLDDLLRQQFSLGDNAIIWGNGSDELIQMITLLVGGKDKTFIFPEPSFSMYRHICQTTNTRYVTVPLQADFRLDGDRLLESIKKHDPACIFLAYPNNPTGNCFDVDTVKRVLDVATGLVVIDEAYFPFCRQTFVHELSAYPNLLILRTLSKNGFAGLRFGFMVGHESWLTQIQKIRLPYNINSLTQASMLFFLRHYSVFDQQALEIIDNRKWLIDQLRELPQFTVYDSQANFVLVRSDPKYGDIQAELLKRGILIKGFDASDTALQHCCRITVGRRQECEKVMQALHDIVACST